MTIQEIVWDALGAIGAVFVFAAASHWLHAGNPSPFLISFGIGAAYAAASAAMRFAVDKMAERLDRK